jgi:hypothetical protein
MIKIRKSIRKGSENKLKSKRKIWLSLRTNTRKYKKYTKERWQT